MIAIHVHMLSYKIKKITFFYENNHFPNDLKKRHVLMYDKLQRLTQLVNVLFITIAHLNLVVFIFLLITIEPNSM